jgi:hypothetical protein
MWPTSLRSRYAHVMVSASRRRADHFRWFQQESRAKFCFIGRYLIRKRSPNPFDNGMALEASCAKSNNKRSPPR